MPVKKVRATVPRKKKSGSTGRRPSVSRLVLPTGKRTADPELLNYISMVYGRGGIGKTTFLESYPNLILFSCERISRGLELFDFNWENGGVTSWDVFLQGVKLLEESDHEFKAVGVDTVDAAYHMCLTEVCRRNGCKYPRKDDFGQTWSQVRTEFRETLLRIPRAGFGLIVTSHSKEDSITAPSGQTHTRIQPSCSGQAYDIIKSMSDVTIYMDWMKTLGGKDIRVMVTQGDEIIDAKNSINLPRFMELPKKGGYDNLNRAMKGEDLGVESRLLLPGRQTSKTAVEMLSTAKASDRVKKRKAKLSTKGVK